MYSFYLGDVLLPVTPSAMSLQIKNQNKTLMLTNGGEINLLKKAGLSKITFSALLPNTPYPFAVYPNGFLPAQYFLQRLESFKDSRKPFQFRLIRSGPSGDLLMDDTNLAVSLEEYKLTEDAEKYGFDVSAEITLLQYQPFGTKIFVVKTDSKGDKTATAAASRDATGKAAETEYTVQSGDSLWSIAKSKLGDASRWPSIYSLNQTAIETAAKKNGWSSSSNGWRIYPGTAIKLPAS